MRDKIKDFFGSSVGITLLVGVVIAYVLPILLTKLDFGVDFTETGQIGDTIGGITGPILNITGLIIVYFSFQQQLEANRKQWEAFSEEQIKSRKDEEFNTIEKQIILFSEDIQAHRLSFRSVNELVGLVMFWDEEEPEDDFLHLVKLQQSTWINWRDDKMLKGPDDVWPLFQDFDWLASYLESQYESITSQIENSTLSIAQQKLLKATIRNKCILPTYSWLPDEEMKKLWDKDEVRFQEAEILSVINQLRVHTPNIFPSIIQPHIKRNRK